MSEEHVAQLELELGQMRLPMESLLQEREQWRANRGPAAAVASTPPVQPARRVILLDVKVSAKPLAFDYTETGFVDFALRLETVMANAFGRGTHACLTRCANEKQVAEEDKYLI